MWLDDWIPRVLALPIVFGVPSLAACQSPSVEHEPKGVVAVLTIRPATRQAHCAPEAQAQVHVLRTLLG